MITPTRQQTARLAGALYLVMGLAGAFSIIYLQRFFIVSGDAAATSANILASPRFYRLGIVCNLINQAGFTWLAVVLCDLFRGVHRSMAALMVALVLVQVAMTFAIMLLQIAPLVLLSGADYLSVFDRSQLNALVLAALSVRAQATIALGVFMGLWLLPLGALVSRSRFMPRWLGPLLVVAGVSYVLSATAFFAAPSYFRPTSVVMTIVAGLAETSMVAWLLVKHLPDETGHNIADAHPSTSAG